MTYKLIKPQIKPLDRPFIGFKFKGRDTTW